LILSLIIIFFQLLVSFDALDQHVKATPSSVERSSESLTRYLIKPIKNDAEKAYVIYSWITRNVRYDVRAYRRGIRSNRDENVLKHRVAVCEGYASLFDKMAKQAGLKTKIISGRARSSTNATNFVPHAWNAVSIDENWKLIDATWGSGNLTADESQFEPNYDRHYFFVNPDVLIASHLPDDPKWQLLSKPVTESEVSTMIQGTSEYHRWQIKPLTHLKNKFESDGFERISIKVPNSIYIAAMLGDRNGEPLPGEHTFIIRKDDYIDVLVSLPKKGTYSLTIFGKASAQEKEYGNLFTYTIEAKNGTKRRFPLTYETYAVNPFNLIEPFPGVISSKDSVLFDMESSAFKSMVLFEGNHVIELDKVGNRFSKKVKLGRGKIQLGGNNTNANSYEILMEFEVE
jgi:hypothetical protein